MINVIGKPAILPGSATCLVVRGDETGRFAYEQCERFRETWNDSGRLGHQGDQGNKDDIATALKHDSVKTSMYIVKP